MAERTDGTMTVDDCANVSRQVSAILDVEDVISSAYRPEVSSPGIDRPLVRLSDYPKFIGHDAKGRDRAAHRRRKRFTGKIKAVEGETVILTVDGKTTTCRSLIFVPPSWC